MRVRSDSARGDWRTKSQSSGPISKISWRHFSSFQTDFLLTLFQFLMSAFLSSWLRMSALQDLINYWLEFWQVNPQSALYYPYHCIAVWNRRWIWLEFRGPKKFSSSKYYLTAWRSAIHQLECSSLDSTFHLFRRSKAKLCATQSVISSPEHCEWNSSIEGWARRPYHSQFWILPTSRTSPLLL